MTELYRGTQWWSGTSWLVRWGCDISGPGLASNDGWAALGCSGTVLPPVNGDGGKLVTLTTEGVLWTRGGGGGDDNDVVVDDEATDDWFLYTHTHTHRHTAMQRLCRHWLIALWPANLIRSCHHRTISQTGRNLHRWERQQSHNSKTANMTLVQIHLEHQLRLTGSHTENQ